MSFVDVFPAEPTTATTRASLFERTSDASRRARRPDRRGRASPPLALRVPTWSTPVLSATKRSPGPTSRESALIAVISPLAPRRARPSAECLDLVPGERDHAAAPLAAAPRARPRDRRTARRRRRCPVPARGPCLRSRRRRPSSASAIARSIAERRSGSISTSTPAPWSTSWMIASGSSRARVVGGHDGEVRQLGGDLPHERALAAVAVASGAEDDDHAAVAERRARLRGRSSSESGVCA